MTIFFDRENKHRLKEIERRRDGMSIYEDLDAAAPTRVLCRAAEHVRIFHPLTQAKPQIDQASDRP